MLRKNEAKTTALILTAVCLSLSLFVSWTSFNLSTVGICKDCSILARIAYSFFHASIPHAIINCWCILSIVFIYNTSLTELFTSYMIAATYPVNTICYVCGNHIAATTPTVGLSAICFALLGMTAFRVRYKLLYHAWIISFITLGFILPYLCSVCGYAIAAPNNIIHIYCYVAGLLVGFLNSPAPWQK